MSMDAEVKKKLPGLFLLSFSTFVVCVPAAFTQIISFDLMLDLNSFPSDDYSWAFPLFVAGECSSMGLCAACLDRCGRRLPYLIGSVIFIASTVVCATATDMATFNGARFVQGFGAGIIIVTCIAQIYYDVRDKEGRYIANGIMSLGFGLGMLFGIFTSKAALEFMGWPVAFWAMAILQALVMYPALNVLKNGERSEMKVDIPGAVILMIWAAVFILLLQKMYLDWDIRSIEFMMGVAFLVMMAVLFVTVEILNPSSMFHRKVDNKRLMLISMVFIVILGVIDMGAVGFMAKIAFFTYQMTVAEAAPFFIVMVLGAATTAITISKTIKRTGHMPWLILSAVLSPIALLSMLQVKEDDPTFMLAVHLFILGLAIGCLVSMLNGTIQNRAGKDNNGALMSFAIMMRTVSLWLGYNFYQYMVDSYMDVKMGDFIQHWNSILPLELPSNSTIANLLITPLGDAIRLLPGLTDEIATVFAEGVANGFIYGAVIFAVIGIPVSLLLYGREKTL